METFGLRRTQSLKSLSGTQERSWVASSTANWNRKSVSQLVQHYQSCADLRSPEKAEQGFEESLPCVDSRWKRLDSRDSGSSWTNLSRCRSMDFLPQKETSGTRALRALFESKASLQQDYHSSLGLNSPSTSVGKAAGACPLQDWKSNNTSPKENTIQRTTQVDGRKAPNGLPESYRHTSRHTHDDKYNPSLSRGGTSTGQSRDRISTSSSVKERLALYLSRTAAIDSVGGSEQPQEFRGTPRTKAKTSKFQSPAKEMCSACLTPVYPVERMVVNKLILHHNCFCCKHCKKKLSTHNYSSLYGEFYCISHYQQLFKRKGNYEVFGHTQHKDRWLHKNKGTDELDAKTTSKMTKNNLKTSAELLSATASINEREHKSVADVKGKLKVRWPPERNITRANPTQPTNAPVLKNKVHDAGKPVTVGESQHWRSEKPDYRKEMTNTAGKEQSKTVNLISAKKSLSEKPVSVKDSTKAAQIPIPPTEREVPLRTSVKNQRVVQARVVTLSKLSSPVSDKLEGSQNKVRKSVRFAQKVDVALCDQSSQIGSGAESENSPEQSKRSLTSRSQDETETNDMKVDSLNSGLEETNGTPEMTLRQDNGDPTTKPNLESNADVETRQEMPRMDDATLTEDVEKVKDSLDCQSHTEISSLTEDNTRQHEPSEKPDVASTGQISKCGSEDLNGPQNPAGHVIEEEASLEMNETQLVTTSSNSEKENTAVQKKALPRTNSKTKLGSLSKGRSPLTKLFTSTGNDKATRAEPKDAKKTDVKPGGGLFGRLFQSSFDTTKTPGQPEKHTKNNTANETAEMEQQTKTEENQEKENISEVVLFEPESANQTSSVLSKETISTSIETVNLSQESIKETGEDLPTPEKTEENPTDQESDLNITVATDQSASDPEKQPEILLTDTNLPNPDPEESVIQSTPEGSSDERLTHPAADDNFVEVASLETEVANQTSSVLSEETISTSIETVNLSQESIKETSEDLPTPEKTEENPADLESDLNITVATDQSASDPEKQPEILLTDTTLPNPDPEESVVQSTPEGSSDGCLTHPVVDNFEEIVSSTQVGEGSIQISTHKSPPNSDKLLDAPDEMGGNLISETLFSSRAENPQDQTNFFDLSESFSLAGSSFLSASAETSAALPHDFSLIDTQPLSAETDASLAMTDPPPDPNSASVKQEDNPDPFSGVNQTNDQIADFDIFGSSNNLFSQPLLFDAPNPNGAEVSTNQFSAFPDDIFGLSHTSDSTALFPVQPNNFNVSNSLSDLLGSDASSTVAPPTQIDLFAGDIFGTGAQLLPVAEPSNVDVFGDTLLVSEGNNTAQKSESSSWMDDLLG